MPDGVCQPYTISDCLGNYFYFVQTNNNGGTKEWGHIRASLRMWFSIIVALDQLKLRFFHT